VGAAGGWGLVDSEGEESVTRARARAADGPHWAASGGEVRARGTEGGGAWARFGPSERGGVFF
jgi:hypothetical protein